MYSFIFPVLYRVVCTVPYGEKWYVKDFVMYERNQNHQSWKWLCYRKNEPGRFPFIGFKWEVSFLECFLTLFGIWYWYFFHTLVYKFQFWASLCVLRRNPETQNEAFCFDLARIPFSSHLYLVFCSWHQTANLFSPIYKFF